MARVKAVENLIIMKNKILFYILGLGTTFGLYVWAYFAYQLVMFNVK